MLVKTPHGDFVVKAVPAPPPAISLPRTALAKYEGTYSYDRLGDLTVERTDADFWVAEIYVDNDTGKIWIDYDNQPRLEIAAFSETEFQLIGFEAQYRFVVDPNTGAVDKFMRMADGQEMYFYRQ